MLFAAHPDPKWVAPPGHVAAPPRHRARPRARRRRTAWLAAQRRGASASSSATRGSRGTTASRAAPGTRSVGYGGDERRRARRGRCPTFVPAAVRGRARARGAALERLGGAARGAALRGVATSTRSRARPPARRASRSSCPARRPRTGCATRSTPTRAIDAQAHLMRDLLRRFGAVPLALAAYNAGPRRGAARAAASRRSPRRRPTSPRILGLLQRRGRSPLGARVRLVA